MQKIGDITNTADSHGEFTNGNVAAGIPPTLLEAEWFNNVQREIINVLLKAGMQPNKTNDAQLSEAIGKLVSDSKVPLTDSLGQSSALATSQKLVNQVNDNANSRLEKAQNGVDIPDKAAFVNHLGLANVVHDNRKINGKALIHDVHLNANDVGAFPFTGGTLNGDLRINGTGFIDFMFGGVNKTSIIAGSLEEGASYLNLSLTPKGGRNDRREIALDLNGGLKRMFLQNGWVLDNYARMTDFEFNADDNGYIRFPGGMMIQWCYGSTDYTGFGDINFPGTWSRRCFGATVINLAGSTPASSFAGVQRVDVRKFRASLKETVGTTNPPKAFFAIGVGQ